MPEKTCGNGLWAIYGTCVSKRWAASQIFSNLTPAWPELLDEAARQLVAHRQGGKVYIPRQRQSGGDQRGPDMPSQNMVLKLKELPYADTKQIMQSRCATWSKIKHGVYLCYATNLLSSILHPWLWFLKLNCQGNASMHCFVQIKGSIRGQDDHAWRKWLPLANTMASYCHFSTKQVHCKSNRGRTRNQHVKSE